MGRVYVPPTTSPPRSYTSNGGAYGVGGNQITNGHIVPKSAPVYRTIEIKIEKPAQEPPETVDKPRIIEIKVVKEEDIASNDRKSV